MGELRVAMCSIVNHYCFTAALVLRVAVCTSRTVVRQVHSSGRYLWKALKVGSFDAANVAIYLLLAGAVAAPSGSKASKSATPVQ